MGSESSNVRRLVASFLKNRAKLERSAATIAAPDDIEDIVQETFLRSYEAAQTRVIRHPRAFMYKTARNLAINQVKRADNRLADSMEEFRSPDVYLATEPLETLVEAKERFLEFCRAVRELPVRCRRVFILKKVYGLTQKEIADYMDISESTVEKHIAKGLLLCRKAMMHPSSDKAVRMDATTRKRTSAIDD